MPSKGAWPPSLLWAILTWRAANGCAQRFMVSRAGASNSSPASATPPPITIISGFNRLTRLASDTRDFRCIHGLLEDLAGATRDCRACGMSFKAADGFIFRQE